MRILILVVLAAGVTFAQSAAPRPLEIENTAAFARLYGVVRHFYPSDAAASLPSPSRANVRGVRRPRRSASRRAWDRRSIRWLFSRRRSVHVPVGDDFDRPWHVGWRVHDHEALPIWRDVPSRYPLSAGDLEGGRQREQALPTELEIRGRFHSFDDLQIAAIDEEQRSLQQRSRRRWRDLKSWTRCCWRAIRAGMLLTRAPPKSSDRSIPPLDEDG